MKTGVITDCFKRPLAESIALAGQLGFDGVQIYATTGEFSPETLRTGQKAQIQDLLASHNLSISALCGDMGGYGFQIAADNPVRIEKTKAIIDLAAEFSVPVVTTHIGVIPDSQSHPRYRVMLDALCACGAYAKSAGVTLAIETGPETAATLAMFLKDTDGGVGVNLDPANFVMVTGQDPVEAVELLAPYIVHTHAKDGIMHRKSDPKIIYDHFAQGGIEALNVSDHFTEMPLGQGQVNWPDYLRALNAAGYAGYLTVERETGPDPLADIRHAKQFLDRLMIK